jgi:hypothetical protein
LTPTSALQELVEELKDPQAFGKSGEAWFLAQFVTVGLLVFPPMPIVGLVDFIGVLLLTTGVVFM